MARVSSRFSRAVRAARLRCGSGLLRVVGEGGVGRLDQHDHTGQSLCDGVVDLAGQSLPFLGDPGRPGQPGHLGPAGVELFDQVPPVPR